MKKTVFVFMMAMNLFLNILNAQTYDTTQYYGKMNYIFQYINKTPITIGLRKDDGIDCLNLNN